jgi:putative mRNA 3-end processing factor
MMKKEKLIIQNSCGLYCKTGNFYIDPWKPVEKAVITHAHSDHARWGSKSYLASAQSEKLLKIRLGDDTAIQCLKYGEQININGVKVSLHPAGHILGSSQVKIEYNGEVWVISGDYKTDKDITCESFELIKCHTFITESTFGLPVYKWFPQENIFEEINDWWRKNNQSGITSIVYSYSLGKAQRVIAGLDTGIGKIFTHGAVENMNMAYRLTGVSLPETKYVNEVSDKNLFKGSIVIAPPSAQAWSAKRFGTISTSFISGWMQIRGNKRRHSVDRGFPLSDHADWDGLIKTIKETGAEEIWVTHGYTTPLVKWLSENGRDAKAVATFYEGEQDDGD